MKQDKSKQEVEEYKKHCDISNFLSLLNIIVMFAI